MAQAIVGFASTYPRARVVVTSRPVGYNAKVLRDADFRHFALEDLDDEQVEAFVQGWFRLVFPDRPREADIVNGAGTTFPRSLAPLAPDLHSSSDWLVQNLPR